ncbi:g2600 [Coccomyxa viridis]|uniref:G2600 protein n=1 Tax=Coccomyxa viridis TaxID=1274662 RepID=A0ABP1FKS8_9CHLO
MSTAHMRKQEQQRQQRLPCSSRAPALLLALAALLRSASGVPLSDWHDGIATNYGGAQDGMNPYDPSFGTKDGACGYGTISKDSYPYWSVAALSLSNSFSVAGPAKACGECFEIKCVDIGGPFAGRCSKDSNQRSVTVTITDTCPECGSDHIDMQALTFNKIAPMEVGRINIQYRRTECTPPEPLNVDINHNFGPGAWLRIVVSKAAGYGSIKLVQLKGADSDWMGMTNKYGEAWEVPVTPKLPWDFRIVGDDGQEVTALGLINAAGKTGAIPTGVQFALKGMSAPSVSNGGGSSGSSSSAPASSPGSSPRGSPSPAGSASSSGKCPCSDQSPDTTYSCDQQKKYGKCDSSWMSIVSPQYPNAFCAKSCGRCPSSCSA